MAAGIVNGFSRTCSVYPTGVSVTTVQAFAAGARSMRTTRTASMPARRSARTSAVPWARRSSTPNP